MNEHRDVSRDEFVAFVTSYPRPLERDVSHIFDPPLVTYNDFALGDWPDSVVASYSAACEPRNAAGGWRILAAHVDTLTIVRSPKAPDAPTEGYDIIHIYGASNVMGSE